MYHRLGTTGTYLVTGEVAPGGTGAERGNPVSSTGCPA